MQPESELEFLIGIDPVQDGDIIGFLSYNEVFPDDSLRKKKENASTMPRYIYNSAQDVIQ